MPSHRMRWLAPWMVAGLLLATPAEAAPSRTRRARVATRFLASQQAENGSMPGFSVLGSTADAAVSLVAARRGAGALEDAMTFLVTRVARDEVEGLGETAKVVMAAVASANDPRDFGGRNLVAEIRATLDARSGRYVESAPNAKVVSHALAMLALHAAEARVAPEASEWLRKAQCRDGGWQFNEPSRRGDNPHCNDGSDFDPVTDTNTTSYAVQALAVAPADRRLRTSPFAYFRSARDPIKGGWRYEHRVRPYGTRMLTDANSTALVIQAYEARGRRLPKGAMRALKALQHRLCGQAPGGFAYTWSKQDGRLRRGPADLGATIGAIPGLLRRPLPVAAFEVTRPAPRPDRCR